jgi:hypothetical protein
MNRISTRRDEREASMDQAADRLAYLALSYGLLGLVIYRSFVDHVASWDLMALVIGAGFVGAAYRLWKGVVTSGWLRVAAITALVALVVAVVLALVARG